MNELKTRWVFHWQETTAFQYSQLMKLLLISHNINYPRKNPIYLKQVCTSLSNQIKFENLKSSLPLKRFIVRLLTTFKSEETKNQIKAPLLYLVNSYFYNYKASPCIICQHRILWKLIINPDKRNGVVILDQKLYDNAIQEIIS